MNRGKDWIRHELPPLVSPRRAVGGDELNRMGGGFETGCARGAVEPATAVRGIAGTRSSMRWGVLGVEMLGAH